jgi:hypothetical protein
VKATSYPLSPRSTARGQLRCGGEGGAEGRITPLLLTDRSRSASAQNLGLAPGRKFETYPRRADSSRGRVAASLYRCDDFVRFREPFFRLFRKHEIAVGNDVELPTGTDEDLGVNADRVLDGGRQTGGPWQVVSNLTVADRDMHGAMLLQPRDGGNCAARHDPPARQPGACISRSACGSLGS